MLIRYFAVSAASVAAALLVIRLDPQPAHVFSSSGSGLPHSRRALSLLSSLAELPAFGLLGVLSSSVALLFVRLRGVVLSSLEALTPLSTRTAINSIDAINQRSPLRTQAQSLRQTVSSICGHAAVRAFLGVMLMVFTLWTNNPNLDFGLASANRSLRDMLTNSCSARTSARLVISRLTMMALLQSLGVFGNVHANC